MRTNKHTVVLEKVVQAVGEKYGDERVEELKNSIRPLAFEAMDREIICQVISRQAWYRIAFFFLLYPRYIVPYMIRSRESDAKPAAPEPAQQGQALTPPEGQ